jgi:diguanylate cyclase (GGDEF)-like protein
LKTRAVWILAAVLVPLIAATHFFGASLVRPLNGLTDGARRVANGDLDVDLPSARRDEIGYLSSVFNDMVERLQDSRRAVSAAQSRLLAQNRRLEELTVTDNLTGLANRRSLTENLARHLARYRRNGRSFSVLILDLDHFKSVNDRYGHLAGDAVLRRFATRLSESIRTVDFAARYGGEEFTVVLFETGRSDAWESAERIRARVEQMRVEVEPAVVLAVTASIGFAEACAADVEPDDLLQRADAAMYQAKQAGRNRVCFAAAPETDANGLIGHG